MGGDGVLIGPFVGNGVGLGVKVPVGVTNGVKVGVIVGVFVIVGVGVTAILSEKTQVCACRFQIYSQLECRSCPKYRLPVKA